MPPQRLFNIMSGDDRSLAGLAARVGLTCAEPFYRAAVAARNLLFDTGLRQPKRLPRPVISVGNITTGGTGKTPMVIEIVRRLLAMGQKPAVLLRGYGFDEQHELDEQINHNRPTERIFRNESGQRTQLFSGLGGWRVPVIADSSRIRAAMSVLDLTPEASVFVLDDGFQHRQLHRDLNLALVDAIEPFGYGHTLPRGLLRESAGNLKRADAVIITRADRIDAARLEEIDREIRRITGRSALALAAHQWTGYDVYARHLIEQAEYPIPADAPTQRQAPLDALRDKRVVAACGIGNPEGFRSMLEAHVGQIMKLSIFPDHHAYQQSDLLQIIDDLRQSGASAIVTTPKDYVKWLKFLPPYVRSELPPELRIPPPIYRPRLAISFLRGGEALDELLRSTITQRVGQPT